jgi:bifunctional DNA-binding transcriptional regulator/antitoxin component of YhaV-PrlF toxin-antitoxin module
VREALKIEDGGRVYFIQDELGRIYIEKAPTLRRERKGKYAVVESPL